jgi:aminopeptidase-like protein
MVAIADDIKQFAELIPAEQLSGDLAEDMYALVRDLFPINRSITGPGVRQTLSRIGQLIDLQITEVPTGTQVFDWRVPPEWSIRDAYIKDSSGTRVVDFQACNLHVVNYSTPVNRQMTLEELRPHLHTVPDKPDWIPYRTSYYDAEWGFCMSHNEFLQLEAGDYSVCIDSELTSGSLTYAESVIPGQSAEEIVIFTHICHPSLCNDNLSGIALSTYLARNLFGQRPRYTYRFIFAPATIGSITWLARNNDRLSSIRHGLVFSVIGDKGDLVYKRSRAGDNEIDRAVEQVFRDQKNDLRIREFSPWGYDERQFCSPGLNLPFGRLTRTPNGEYPEYHTSADNLSVVKPEFLLDSFHAVWSIFSVLEGNSTYLNQSPYGEPRLGRRGLYRKLGGFSSVEDEQLAMLWLLNLSDGNHSILDIAMKSGLPFKTIRSVANLLIDAKLLAEPPTSAAIQL